MSYPPDDSDMAFRGMLAIFLIAAFIALCFAFNTGCAHTPEPLVVTKVITVPVKERCATTPPPKYRQLEKPTVCGDKICLTTGGAADLAWDVERLLEWVANTWDACRPSTGPVTP